MIEPLIKTGVHGAAIFSACEQYRYVLVRNIGNPNTHRTAAFIMLNPSTADHEVDDATIRRCTGFARMLNCAALMVCNVYAFRATDPKELKLVADPVGPDNHHYLTEVAQGIRDRNGIAIAAWGTLARPEDVLPVTSIFRARDIPLYQLGLTKDGHPRHPLYLPNNATLQVYKGT